MSSAQHASRLKSSDRAKFGSRSAKRRPRLAFAAATRRDLLLATLVPGFLDETEPNRGNCPTCIGVVDGTLGSCAGLGSCLSSFDDRPGHFVAPWMYDTGSRKEAVVQLVNAAQSLGGTVRQLEDGPSYSYVYATWQHDGWLLGATDDVEFFLTDGDNTVVLRSSSRLAALPDGGRNERRLEQLRQRLGWEQVPILRNRRRALYFVESPWDSFGPVPPSDTDFRYDSELDEQ